MTCSDKLITLHFEIYALNCNADSPKELLLKVTVLDRIWDTITQWRKSVFFELSQVM